ncbi:hypothetical protein KR009_011292, partial [Drosophila setifemur]
FPGPASSLYLNALLLVLMVHLSTQTQYLNSTEDICQLFSDGTKLRKPGDCGEWIVCQNQKRSTGGSCTTSKPYFKLSTGACASAADGSYCISNPCAASTQGYIGDDMNCANWYYCDGKELKGKGSCTTGMYFNKVTKQCLYPKDTVCEAKYEWCDIVPTGVPFRDVNNCHKYYTCKSYKAVVNTCETGKYYDVTTGKCIDQKLVVCDAHPLPEDVCGTKKLAFRNKFVSDGATCRGYYYCRDLGSGVPDPDPVYQQCDVDNFFNVERQACMPRESQKCSLDRCDGRDSGYEIAEDKGCQHYYECVDGRESSPMKCEDGLTFDVVAQKCTDSEKSYGACAA